MLPPKHSRFVGATTLGGVVADRKLFVGSLVAVAVLTCTYSIVAGAIENGGHDVLFEAGGAESFLDGASSVRERGGNYGVMPVPRM